jgi:hypothetical protein
MKQPALRRLPKTGFRPFQLWRGNPGWRTSVGGALAALAAILISTPLAAQVFRREIQVEANNGAGVVILNGQFVGQDDTPETVDSNAVLKTDPDLEAILERAERHRADGNYRVATHFWQTVLDRSGDALFSSDDTIYYSLVQQVEKTLAELPPE